MVLLESVDDDCCLYLFANGFRNSPAFAKSYLLQLLGECGEVRGE